MKKPSPSPTMIQSNNTSIELGRASHPNEARTLLSMSTFQPECYLQLRYFDITPIRIQSWVLFREDCKTEQFEDERGIYVTVRALKRHSAVSLVMTLLPYSKLLRYFKFFLGLGAGSVLGRCQNIALQFCFILPRLPCPNFLPPPL
jgi:hypothetical protein